MAGHSKWANIKHRKGKADAKKGKIFSRIAKEIISAAKIGGSDPKSNPRLRLVLQKAREANVTNDIIERNIKKGASADQADYIEVVYELYGHGGVGIIVDIMTENKARIASDIRVAINKKGGVIANPGAVSFNFDRRGIIQVVKNHAIEDELFKAALEAGAEDFEIENEGYVITTDPFDLYTVKEAIEKLGFPCDSASLEMIPKNYVECDKATIESNLALIKWLEQIEDVDEVFHNMKLPDNLDSE